MENRKRNIQMKFYVTEEEKRLIDEKMKQLPIKQYGAYFRKMAIDGYRDPIQCKCGAIMQYTYTYNPLEDKRNDRTYRKRCIDEMYKMRLRRRST